MFDGPNLGSLRIDTFHGIVTDMVNGASPRQPANMNGTVAYEWDIGDVMLRHETKRSPTGNIAQSSAAENWQTATVSLEGPEDDVYSVESAIDDALVGYNSPRLQMSTGKMIIQDTRDRNAGGYLGNRLSDDLDLRVTSSACGLNFRGDPGLRGSKVWRWDLAYEPNGKLPSTSPDRQSIAVIYYVQPMPGFDSIYRARIDIGSSQGIPPRIMAGLENAIYATLGTQKRELVKENVA